MATFQERYTQSVVLFEAWGTVVSSDMVVNRGQIDLDPTHSDGSTTLSHDHIYFHSMSESNYGSCGNRTCITNQSASVLRQVVCGVPPYEEAAAPNFQWDEIDGETFSTTLCTGKEIFSDYHQEKLTKHLSGSCLDYSMLLVIAQECAMVLPVLLQKPHIKSKAKDHSTIMECRLKQLEMGDINSLVIEARTI